MIDRILVILLIIGALTSSAHGQVTTKPLPQLNLQDPRPMGLYLQMMDYWLDETTRNPKSSVGGSVVWNTRYYLESLLTAYEVTQDRSFLYRFVPTANRVMDLFERHTVEITPQRMKYELGLGAMTGRGLEFIDGSLNTPPQTIDLAGWPETLATIGRPTPIPSTQNGISFLAQALSGAKYPIPDSLRVSREDKFIRLTWTKGGKALNSDILRTRNDWESLNARPLINGTSTHRIFQWEGALPKVGSYPLLPSPPIIWYAEQTAGIGLPLVRFLYLVQKQPDLSQDPALQVRWLSKIIEAAECYEIAFEQTSSHGLEIRNPPFYPLSDAGLPILPNYIYAEVSFRILLFRLTKQVKHFTIARGLIQDMKKYWKVNSQGHLLLQHWPNAPKWDHSAFQERGSIWDQWQYDRSFPEDTGHVQVFAEVLHLARTLGLEGRLGIPSEIRKAAQRTHSEVLWVPPAEGFGEGWRFRNLFPFADGRVLGVEPIPEDPFQCTSMLPLVDTSDSWYVQRLWETLARFGRAPGNQPIGYMLKAWARLDAMRSGHRGY